MPKGVNSKYFIGVLSLALALRVFTVVRIDPVALDSALYFEIARLIETGRWTAAMAYPFPPLYPALIAGLASLGMTPDAAGLLVSFTAGILVMFPLFSLTRALAGEKAASWAAFLWAIHPYAIRLSVRALSDTPTALLVALSLWTGLRGLQTGRHLWVIVGGALSGLAYLSRPEGIEAALGLAALFGVFTWIGSSPTSFSTGSRPLLRRLLWTAAPLAGWAVVAAPYITFISLEAGTLTFSKKKSPAAMATSIAPAAEPDSPPAPRPPVPERPGDAPALGSEATKPDRGRLSTAARNIYVFQQPLVNGIHPVVLLPSLLAPLQLRRSRNAQQDAITKLFLGLMLLHLLVLIGLAALLGPSYLGGHHVFLMALYMVPFAGAGLAAAFEGVSLKAPDARWAQAATVAALIAVTLPSSVFRRPESGKVFRTAGLWIRDNSPAPPTVITNSPKLAFHAGARRLPLSGRSESVIDLARRSGADFVAFEADANKERDRDFQWQVDAGALEVAGTFSERSRSKIYTVVVYRLRQAASREQ